MAGPLAAIERFFERLLERPAARLFQARLEPIHLQRQLERTMDAERRLGDRRTYVPSVYRIELNAHDLAAFEPYRDSLVTDLAGAVHSHARSRGYTLTARPRVELAVSASVAEGDVVVLPEGNPPAHGRPLERAAAPADIPVAPPAPADKDRSADVHAPPPPVARQPPSTQEPPRAEQASAGSPVENERGAAARDGAAGAGQPGALASPPAGARPNIGRPDTSSYSAPRPNLPNAVVVLRVPGQEARRLALSSGTVRIGRALDNDIVLADDRVSRRHGQFSVRLGTLIYTDLGSTNGSYLNGSGVSEIALGPGDVLQLGSSTLAIEQGN